MVYVLARSHTEANETLASDRMWRVAKNNNRTIDMQTVEILVSVLLTDLHTPSLRARVLHVLRVLSYDSNPESTQFASHASSSS